MSRFRLTEQAQSDLDQIWNEIGNINFNPSAADRLLDKLFRHLSLLASQPRIGQSRDEWSPDLRIFPVGNYVILYYPGSDEIEVIGIVYGRRDLPAIFDQGRRRHDS